MAQGVKTDASVEREFRKHYLRTGNARKSARLVGIPEDTGRSLADRANADSEFTRARTELRARLVPDVVAMVLGAVEVASERIDDAEWCQSFKGSDPAPQYLRGITDALKQLSALDAGNDKPAPEGPAVVINLNVEPEAKAPEGE